MIRGLFALLAWLARQFTRPAPTRYFDHTNSAAPLRPDSGGKEIM